MLEPHAIILTFSWSTTHEKKLQAWTSIYANTLKIVVEQALMSRDSLVSSDDLDCNKFGNWQIQCHRRWSELLQLLLYKNCTMHRLHWFQLLLQLPYWAFSGMSAATERRFSLSQFVHWQTWLKWIIMENVLWHASHTVTFCVPDFAKLERSVEYKAIDVVKVWPRGPCYSQF